MSFKASSYQKNIVADETDKEDPRLSASAALCVQKDPLSRRGSKKCCGSAIAVRTSLVVSVVSH